MATVYVKSVEASSWSRTEWTSGNGYVVGERLYKAIADGSAYENLVKTYACIVDNNSTTDPETDTANWARVGFSEEYPFHAPDGNLVHTTNTGEVYLDGLNQRYKGMGSSERSFWHHVQNFGADSEGTAIFLDGTYFTASPIPGEKINYVAKNQGKVTFNLNTSSMSGVVFGFNFGHHNRHEGINYQVGGNVGLFQHNTTLSSFKNCVFTDEDSIHGNYTSASNSLGYSNFIEFENCLLNLPNSTCHIAGHNLELGPNGRDALWKNSTFIMQFGNSNEFEPTFYQTDSNSPITLEKCVFYITSHIYSGAATSYGSGVGQHNFMNSGVKATDCIAFSADNSLPEIISNNSGLTIRNPLFIDPSNGDFRLRPSSPLIGGGLSSSKFPADAVWMQTGSGTGTGTESDPYYLDQWSDALAAATSSTFKKIVLKDGTYALNGSGQQGVTWLADSNLNSVTFTSENLHGATITDGGWRISPPAGVDNTLNLEGVKLEPTDHFIHSGQSQGILKLVANNCKIKAPKYLHFYDHQISNSILEITAFNLSILSGPSGTLKNCTLINNNANVTAVLVSANHTCTNCIFWTPNTSSAKPGGSTTDCISYNFATQSGCVDSDPLFIDVANEDFRLRPSSAGVGGTKPEESNVYYLQPGNTYNGDGSQKDASAMTTDGDPGPFNAFHKINAAGVAYGSKVIILNGTYPWQSELGNYGVTASNWEQFTYAGYNYEAETTGEVIFDGAKDTQYLFYQPYGGTAGAGTYLDLDTSFKGVVLQDVTGGASYTRNVISTLSGSASQGSLLFDGCQFLRWTNTGTSTSFPLTGGMRDFPGSVLKFHNCTITYCTEGAGLFNGGDQAAKNSLHGAWEYINNTIAILGVGETSFNGRNSASTYKRPGYIFATTDVSQHIVKNNIFYMSGTDGSTNIGSTNASYLPSFSNNLFFNVDLTSGGNHLDLISVTNQVDIDPLFVDPAGSNFSLRPNSPLIGKG